MPDVVIVGAGGHGQVVADILLCALRAGSAWRPKGFLDDDPALRDRRVLGLPVLGRVVDLGKVGADGVVVAVGENDRRARLFEQVRRADLTAVKAVHPSAVLGSEVSLGDGIMICAGVVVNTGSVIGEDVILNTGCTVDHHARIAPHAHVAPGSHLGGNVTVGARALIGIGAVVLPGCEIGEGAVVGAGSLVVQSVPAGVTVAGAPARPLATDRPGP